MTPLNVFQINSLDRVLILFSFLFLGFVTTSCGQEKKNKATKEKTTTSADTKPLNTVNTVIIPVEGMSCGSCVANVKRTVHSLIGVKAVEISLEKRQAKVSYAKGEISPEQVIKAINELGYKAGEPVEAKKD